MSEPAMKLPVVLIGTQGRIKQVNELRLSMEERIDDYESRGANRTARLAADHLAAAAYWMGEYLKEIGMGE